MNVVIGSDKVGMNLKEAIQQHLEQLGHNVIDVGTTDPDHPRPHNITSPAAAKLIQSGGAERGILICGTGMGMSIAANKNKGIYAAVVESVYTAEYCRKINDANVLCLGAFVVGQGMALEMVDKFMCTEFVENFEQWRVDFLTAQKGILRKHEDAVFVE